ncbi:MAG: IS3 family transposase [Gammaproteobacteria bacterium]|nr:IS3 family transposase [Gammaproteobacteria bacterium]
MKYAFIDRERTRFPLQLLCEVLEVSASGFHDHRRRLTDPGPDPEAALRGELRALHASSRGTYGRPRLVAGLRQRAHRVGHKRVARLMREEGLQGKSKGRRRPRTTDSRHARPVAENVLERRFAVTSEVPAWVSDITYVPTREGWLYLAAILSVQTRQVLGYSLSDRMPDELVEQALLNAWTRYPAERGVLFHSDRGSQYASKDFRRLSAGLGFVPSMSRKGNCWDNAVAESFFATLKNEEITEPYATKVLAHIGIAKYIHGFYNPERLHSALGYLSPDAYAKKLDLN